MNIKNCLKQALKVITLFLCGGSLYFVVEILWRGHSHTSMFILGGICFFLIGLINEFFSWELGLVWQCIIGAGIITILELITGFIVNICLGLGVWDYSALPYNLYGQICLQYFLLWIPLSSVAIIIDDCIRYVLFNEKYSRYYIF